MRVVEQVRQMQPLVPTEEVGKALLSGQPSDSGHGLLRVHEQHAVLQVGGWKRHGDAGDIYPVQLTEQVLSKLLNKIP